MYSQMTNSRPTCTSPSISNGDACYRTDLLMDFYWTKSGGEQAQTMDARLEWWEKTEKCVKCGT